LTILREISTRISPQPPTAIVDRHDDADRQPHQTRPNILHPLNANDSGSRTLSPQLADDDFIDRTLGKIAQMMQCWPSPTAIDQDPCNILSSAPCHPSSPPSPEIPIVNDEPFDYGSQLDEITAKVKQMSRRWPLTSVMIDPNANTIACPLPPVTSSPQHTLPTLTNTLSHAANCTVPTAPSRFLDFFIKTDSSINRHSDDRHKPHKVQPPLSLQDTFDLQLLVLDKITTVCDGLNNLLDRYITDLPCPPTNLYHCCIMPACPKPATISNLHRPSLFPESITAFVPLKHRLALVSAKIILYATPIPVKPPYSRDHRYPTMIRTKDWMRPP